ncbi:hypothetical protein Hte_006417 [Hypoxylon texense]
MALLPCPDALRDLLEALPHSCFCFPGSEAYDYENSVYLSAVNRRYKPSCIILPSTKEEISTFVRVIKPYALRGDTAFAIAGNGRQTSPDCNNINNGITIRLNRLRGIEIDEGTKTVRIAAGEWWGRVYDKLEEKNLEVAGGTSHKLGVAGQALQGAAPFFYSRNGFICDNVINYEVVLASGQIVNANAEENADLWRALRGGGNNFGIVTRFDMRTFENLEIYGGFVQYTDSSEFTDQIRAFVEELTSPNTSKETDIMISAHIFREDDIRCENRIYADYPTENWPSFLMPLVPYASRLGPDGVGRTTLATAVTEPTEFERFCSVGIRRYACINSTLKPDLRTLHAAWNIFRRTVKAAYRDARNAGIDMVFSMSLQPYTRAMLETSAQRGGNSLGLSPDLGPLVSVRLLAGWKDKEHDGTVYAIIDRAMSMIRVQVLDNHVGPVSYIDTSYSTFENFFTYEDLNALQKVSRKYDPEGLFQTGVPGGFKLFTPVS